ncbi:DnaD domain-containing protein [Virgibacillus halodenitrificans]|uniref:DnaD domain-containing protein n=1 Tax=Virgibacillus halodenitrificans TaxID=1482 RepID=UPI0002E83F22|nr:DnaD domain protein [Virgibacillus halodenitrificans]
MKGYIKDFRKELQSDIWMMPPLYHRVWQYLKYMVNHKENKVPMRDGSFMTIKQGQHLTSMRKIANQVGYYEQGAWKEPNPKTIKSILTWLEKQNMISISNGDGNRKYTLITLLNWELYQSTNEDGNSKYTVNTQSMDINKNDKNDKELFSSSTEQEFSEVMNFYQANLQRGVTESPFNHELIGQWFDEWGSGLLLASMKVAAKAEAKGVNMVEGILKNWKEAGVKTVEDARKYEMEFKAKKPNNTIPFKPKRPKEAEDDGYNYGF